MIAKGQKCGMCWREQMKVQEATHVIQNITDGEKNTIQYVCDKHYERIMGKLELTNDYKIKIK